MSENPMRKLSITFLNCLKTGFLSEDLFCPFPYGHLPLAPLPPTGTSRVRVHLKGKTPLWEYTASTDDGVGESQLSALGLRWALVKMKPVGLLAGQKFSLIDL